jgi:apoptosis-inducing factor 2
MSVGDCVLTDPEDLAWLMYTGAKAAEQLAVELSSRFRVLLINKNSHFQHLFAFPRFAVTDKVNTYKAFIPYGRHTFGGSPDESARFIQARVASLSKSSIHLDRQIEIDGMRTDSIPYAFLVIATGTKLTPPSSLPGTEKLAGVEYLQKHAQTVMRSSRIVIIGGGAVGVQTATDIKELYPEKSVTLVHSRKHLMNKFESRFHELIAERCAELGIDTKLGSRVKVPSEGFRTDGKTFDVELEDGAAIPADFVVRGDFPGSPETIDG